MAQPMTSWAHIIQRVPAGNGLSIKRCSCGFESAPAPYDTLGINCPVLDRELAEQREKRTA